jgi:hypothetical protein
VKQVIAELWARWIEWWCSGSGVFTGESSVAVLLCYFARRARESESEGDGGANERGRDVAPSELHPKQTTKPCHQHHVYVIMRVIKYEDKFLVTKMINENVK